VTQPQQQLLDRLLQIGWKLAGVAPDEADHTIDEGLRRIFVASEVIDDLQDMIQPVATARLNSGINDGLEALISGLIELPANCLRHALHSIQTAISGQIRDVSTTITDEAMDHDRIIDHCKSVSRQKTGSLIQLAFTLPWLSRNEAADSPPDPIRDLGTAAGIAIQALNDWDGLRLPTESEDVFHGRVTWIWEWLSANRGDDKEFERLRTTAGACIGKRKKARKLHTRLTSQVDSPEYLRRTSNRYQSALAGISWGDIPNVGAELQSTIFARAQQHCPTGGLPPEAP